MDKEIINWLLEGPAWLRYAVELQLLEQRPDVTPVLRDGAIKKLVTRLKDSQAGIPALKSGKVHYTDPCKAYWDLYFLADIGLTVADLGLADEAEAVFRFQAPDGTFTIPPNVKPDYFCMSAILIASLARMGYRDDPRVGKYIHAVMETQGKEGWDCYGGGIMGTGSCPMDDQNILMLLGQYEKYRNNPGLNGAIGQLLEHWEIGNNIYGFGVGQRFRSLQYPAVKYGILRVLDVLSLFPYAVARPGFQGMLDFVRGKAGDGRYRAEMTDDAYAGFDFSQKAEPSRWLTFLVNRIEKRVGV